MKPSGVFCYLDDVVIPSRTTEEGIERLQRFLELLKKSNLTLRLDKCFFLAMEIKFLGHVINCEGITPGTTKVNAIKNFKMPINGADFWGLLVSFGNSSPILRALPNL